MATVKESISIAAPAQRIFAVVHDEAMDSMRWTRDLTKVEELSGSPGPGWKLRYHLTVAGVGAVQIDLDHTVWKPPTHCAGVVVAGPIKGSTWEWRYRESGKRTQVTYAMELRGGGVLRFAGGVIAQAYSKAMKSNLESLRDCIEGGAGS